MANQNVVLLGQPIWDEDNKAAEVITPGHLVAMDGSGNIVKHPTLGGFAPATFADARHEMGAGRINSMSGAYSVTNTYAVNDVVKVAHCYPGMRVYAWIASGVSVTKGNFMQSAGDGTLMVQTSTNHRVARSLETKVAAFTGLTQLRVEIV